jgi:hypothetical protein
MKKLSWLLIIGLYSCGLPHPSIPEFDAEAWGNDKKGCGETRLQSVAQLYEYKDMLLGFNQNEIKHYLGRPDEQELYNRSQTFFHYYVSSHEECGTSENSSVIVQIRFNALNSSNEVYFRNYQP